ncbi:MAG: hypothetical protein U1E73_09065 [Planctomycetota bacterium]
MFRYQVSLLALALATTAAAQTPPCLAYNDTNTAVSGAVTLYGFAGENSFAWQITPTAGAVLLAGQVFTRNTALTGDRFMRLEVWSDNGGAPGSRLCGGAWRIQNARPNAWQGADFDTPAVLAANTPVWVVWVEPGFSTPAEEPGGTPLPKMTRSGAGSWSTAAASAVKLRLFCTLLDDTNTVPYGPACLQSTSTYASVYANEAPQLGNNLFAFEMSGIAPSAPVFVVLGFDPLFVSTPVAGLPSGCMQNTDILATTLVFGGTGTTRGPTCSNYAELAFPLPGNPGFLGQLIAVQCAPYDAGAAAPLPFAPSNALRVTLF